MHLRQFRSESRIMVLGLIAETTTSPPLFLVFLQLKSISEFQIQLSLSVS